MLQLVKCPPFLLHNSFFLLHNNIIFHSLLFFLFIPLLSHLYLFFHNNLRFSSGTELKPPHPPFDFFPSFLQISLGENRVDIQGHFLLACVHLHNLLSLSHQIFHKFKKLFFFHLMGVGNIGGFVFELHKCLNKQIQSLVSILVLLLTMDDGVSLICDSFHLLLQYIQLCVVSFLIQPLGRLIQDLKDVIHFGLVGKFQKLVVFGELFSHGIDERFK
mmetsp:Transcript_5222/g.7842  ORF Transcript_5222/g.7842 Transcript_5222/m.7842 type:complete len:217 (+) Transcript_5222:84-734(+)